MLYGPPTGSEVRRVAVVGELADWLNSIPLPRRPDGSFGLDVALTAGVYAYKFLVDGAWTLDPGNPRTRSTDGHRNNVLVVGGTDEPVLHAPAPPYVTEMDGGGLRIVAAVRRTTEDPPVVRWTERGGEPVSVVAARRLKANDLARGLPRHASMTFVSTHDHPRLATLCAAAGAPERARLGLVLLACMPGVPALLYGEELGLRGTAPAPEEDAWSDRAPMPWTGQRSDPHTRPLVRALLEARRASPALASGELEVIHADGSLFAIRRSAPGEVVDVYVNKGDRGISFEAVDDTFDDLEPLVLVGGAEAGRQDVTLPARSAVLARRVRSDAGRHARVVLSTRDAEFRAARATTQATPTRIDFAVTERCNMRCQHCITFAPARTQAGTARTLTPWVVERLRPWLGAATYFGFVHGGESLTAPIFLDLLKVIQDERGGRPTMVHVLSNGLLLSESVTRELVTLGVRSLSVSLDGAVASTNDAVRMGGRFDHVVSNLRGVARLRRETGADLRLGISFVCLEQNVGEIGALLELAADIGVDWVKLEELAPVNDFSRRSLPMLEGRARAVTLSDARSHARRLGLVLVDHTIERTVWRCRLRDEPDTAEFVEADEFANRSTIHPCRAPWEVACAEPNGDVRIGHFFGPVLGNVATHSLAEMWNGAAARTERSRSHAQRVCGLEGPVTCLDD